MKLRQKMTGLFALLMAVVVFAAGCSGGNNPGNAGANSAENHDGTGQNTGTEPVSIMFWNMFGGGEGDFVDQIVKDFNSSQDEVVVETLRLESNEYYAKFGTALASGKGPDVEITILIDWLPLVESRATGSS